MAAEWQDTTTYVKYDKDPKPNVWTIESGSLRISISNGHTAYRGTDIWIMHCYKLGIDTKPLKGKNLTDCQAEAIQEVWKAIGRLNTDYSGLV